MTTTKREKGSKPAPKKRLIAHIVLIVIASLLIGGTVYSANAKNMLHNAMPMPFGFGVSVILSGSMEPELSVNDAVVVTPSDEYKAGDIVVYQSGMGLVIHRIVSTGDGYAVTQGDANNTADEPVAIKDIKGKMAFSVPMLGVIVRPLQSASGKAVMIVIVLFLFVMSKRKEQEERDEQIDRIKEEIRRLKETQGS